MCAPYNHFHWTQIEKLASILTQEKNIKRENSWKEEPVSLLSNDIILHIETQKNYRKYIRNNQSLSNG